MNNASPVCLARFHDRGAQRSLVPRLHIGARDSASVCGEAAFHVDGTMEDIASSRTFTMISMSWLLSSTCIKSAPLRCRRALLYARRLYQWILGNSST